jgi:DNA-binding winged helix-turn-helix (wHTH) protein
MGLAFGDLELDLSLFELRLHGPRVPLEPQAFDVLRYLVEHRDRVVSKEELMDQIWGGRFVTETAVTSRIKQIRRAVGDDGQSQTVIKTLHGRGYRFAPPDRDRHESASRRPAAAIQQPSQQPQPDPRSAPPDPTNRGIADQLVAASQPAASQLLVGRTAERQRLHALVDDARRATGRSC